MPLLKNQRHQKNQLNQRSAFTLIELLVVIAIIGLLATLSVIALNNARAKSRDAKRLADAKQVETAMELFFNAAGRYPTDAEFATGRIEYNSGSGTTTYMQVIPTAPTPADGACTTASNAYTYHQTGGGASYTMDFCVAQASPDLGGGVLSVWPGGISGGNGGAQSGACTLNSQCDTGSICSNGSCRSTLNYGGVSYGFIKVGTQYWLDKNLNIGTLLCSSNAGNNTCTESPSNNNAIEKYCYNNDESVCNTYGAIYNWGEAMGLDSGCLLSNVDCDSNPSDECCNLSSHHDICPAGWHIPTYTEVSTAISSPDCGLLNIEAIYRGSYVDPGFGYSPYFMTNQNISNFWIGSHGNSGQAYNAYNFSDNSICNYSVDGPSTSYGSLTELKSVRCIQDQQ